MRHSVIKSDVMLNVTYWMNWLLLLMLSLKKSKIQSENDHTTSILPKWHQIQTSCECYNMKLFSLLSFLTAGECTLKVCPFGVPPLAAWTTPPLGHPGTESLPEWKSPKAKPQTTSWRQEQWGVLIITFVFPTFHHGWIGQVARGTHTSLWCVYIRSNRASGAIHLTGRRPCEKHV